MRSAPGVYVTESPLPRVVSGSSPVQSYGAFIGTALRGPTEPTLIKSWSEFVSLFGGYGSTTTLPQALNQYFINTGNSAYVCRVVPSGAVKASSTFSDDSKDRLIFTAATGGEWGNGIGYIIRTDSSAKEFEIQILEQVMNSWVTRERFSRLSMDRTSPRYVVNIINSSTIGSQLVTVEDVAKDDTLIDIGTANRTDLSGGSKGTGPVDKADYVEALHKFDGIEGMLVFNLPGVSAISGAAGYVQTRGDSVLIADTEENLDVEGVLAEVAPQESSYVAVYYPWIHIVDRDPFAARGAVRKVPPGASVVGMILATDARRGIFKAPAGVGATLSGAVATERRLTNTELDRLAASNINVIRPVPGSGITVMGARTLSNGTARYLSVRRVLNYVKTQAAEASRFALFEPNTPNLWDQLRVVNGSFLAELWRAGGLQGLTSNEAFYVKADNENNTPITIANGEVHIEIGVAPVFPSEFVIIRVGQFESDASVIVSEEV